MIARHWWSVLTAVLSAAGGALAQSGGWEAGFGGGASTYLKKDFNTPAGDATAGFKTNFAASGWLGQNLHDYVSGEIRYDFLNNDLLLQGADRELGFDARSHALQYAILWHTSPRTSRVRPFFTCGAGIKGYFGRGEEVAAQPLREFAFLTRTSEWKFLLTFGGGVKIRLGRRWSLRAEVRDFTTPFPTGVILPADGADLGGWIHNLVPQVGIALTF